MSGSRSSQPGRMTVPPSPAEIIELYPVPRVQLVLALRIDPSADPVRVARAAVEFTSKVLTTDRKLRLELTPGVAAAGGELALFFKPLAMGSDIAGRLERVVGVVREAITAFGDATLVRAEVVPQA